jgi:peptidoglycan/LPS O-acetylase OafA/YrhL
VNARALRRIAIVLYPLAILALFVSVFASERQGDHATGPAWAIALFVLSNVVMAVFAGTRAVVQHHLDASVIAVVQLSAAFLWAMPREGAPRPGWLAVVGVVVLAIIVFGAIPMLVYLWRSQRDERQRAIFGSASSIAFGVVVIVAAVFALLGNPHFSTLAVPALTPSWIVILAVGTWSVAMLVLGRRM